MASFSSEDQLDDENKFYCSNCKCHQNAIKKMEIYRPPINMIIHLKRFKHVNRTGINYYFSSPFTKNTEKVHFPIKQFDITKYIVGKVGKD